MKIDSIIAEVESSLSSYKAAGLIDKVSLYRWTNQVLKKFGQSICTMTEKVIHVKDGVAHLPDGFFSLHFAIYCSPKGYYVNPSEKPGILNSQIWKQRIERKSEWNSCDPCCTTESESIITEEVYIDDTKVSFYYENPIVLRLGKAFKKDFCTNDCKNKYILESPYEINIVGTTLYTNFNEGTIYMQYYGLEQDERGLPLIPDTPKGEVAVYVEYHLKKKIIEQILTNGDDVNLINLLNYYTQQEREKYIAAMADAKFQTLNFNSYRKLAEQNRRTIQKVENLLPRR